MVPRQVGLASESCSWDWSRWTCPRKWANPSSLRSMNFQIFKILAITIFVMVVAAIIIKAPEALAAGAKAAASDDKAVHH